MHRNRRIRRAILELICLTTLLVAAIEIWNGPAALTQPDRLDASATVSAVVAPHASVMVQGDRYEPQAQARADASIVPPAPDRSCRLVLARNPHHACLAPTSATRSANLFQRVTTAMGRADLIDASAVATRFWDGVVEYGCPRRTIQLVDNEVEHPAAATDLTRVGRQGWPRPTALLDELSQLESPIAMGWADAVRQPLRELEGVKRLDDDEASPLLAQLAALTSQVEAIAEKLPTFEEQYRIRHAAYALQRRLQIWRAVMLASSPQVSADVVQLGDGWNAEQLSSLIDELQQWLPSLPNGNDWLEFLAVNGLATDLTHPASQQHVELARYVCRQIESVKLSPAQREFLATPLLEAYQANLRRLAIAPVDFPEFLRLLESFESDAASADLLVAMWNEIGWVPVPAYQQVAQVLNLHYRNANIRLSMTEEFANRFLPAVQRARAPVREQLLGADVQGLSDTLTKVNVKFVPDPNEIRLKLEAKGQMAAQTQSTKGPVTLFNNNRSSYILQKLLTLDPQGLRVGNTRARATANTNLTGLRTRYDGFPLVGTMVRRIARQKHYESRQLTHRLLGDRIAMRIKQRLDAQLEQQMLQARQRLENNVIRPLEEMNLSPEALAMETTENRLVLRGRLAGSTQLAAYTARPQAVADNLLSIQLHESALNNFLDQMELGGRYMEVRSMVRQVLDEWELQATPIPEDLPEGVKLELVDTHPIVVHCDGDRVQVEISVRRLTDEYSHRTWRNFQVRAHFVPHTEGFSCELHRDGIVELESLGPRRLGNRDQFALRAIFGRVFSKNHPLQVVTPDLNDDPRLRELNVDQFVIRDGWIGISVGQEPAPQISRATTTSASF